jgi:hypothetical protein
MSDLLVPRQGTRFPVVSYHTDPPRLIGELLLYAVSLLGFVGLFGLMLVRGEWGAIGRFFLRDPRFFVLPLLAFGFARRIRILGTEMREGGCRMVLDEVGYTDRTLGVGRIPWEEIQEVGVGEKAQEAEFEILLKPSAPSRKSLSWYVRLQTWGRNALPVSLHGTDADREVLMKEMRYRIEVTRRLGPVVPLLVTTGKKAVDSGGSEEEAFPGEQDLPGSLV